MPSYALEDRTPSLPPPGRFWIAPDAHVIGAVTLAEEVGVWFGAVLRGDNEPITVGRGSNIQEAAILHTDVGYPLRVGRDVTVGHRALLHGCTIGDGCLVGMGATVMNGARIGAHCLIGAGALVTERKSFPDRVLIAGSPATVRRELDDEAVEVLRQSALRYVANWRRFALALRRLD